MGARRFGPDSNKWGRWRSAVVVRGANGGPRRRRWARSAGQHAVGDHPGAGWRESAGTFGCPVVGQSPTAPSGWEWNRLQPGEGATELLLPRPAPGKMQSQPACRAGEPSGQGEEPPPEGLGGHYLLAQAQPRRPAGQVVGHHLGGQPGGVGGEAARGEMIQPYAVLEVSDGVLDLGVAAMISLQFRVSPSRSVMKP